MSYWDLTPENKELFFRCVDGALEDMMESGKLDYEWMAYYDDHVADMHADNQDVHNSTFKYHVLKRYMKKVGRKGPEWTVYRDLPCNTWNPADRLAPGRYIPIKENMRIVAFKSSVKTKMVDFNKKVLPYIRQHPDVEKVIFVHMRIPTQWRNGELPVLLG